MKEQVKVGEDFLYRWIRFWTAFCGYLLRDMKVKITCTNWAAFKTYLQNKEVSYN